MTLPVELLLLYDYSKCKFLSLCLSVENDQHHFVQRWSCFLWISGQIHRVFYEFDFICHSIWSLFSLIFRFCIQYICTLYVVYLATGSIPRDDQHLMLEGTSGSIRDTAWIVPSCTWSLFIWCFSLHQIPYIFWWKMSIFILAITRLISHSWTCDCISFNLSHSEVQVIPRMC